MGCSLFLVLMIWQIFWGFFFREMGSAESAFISLSPKKPPLTIGNPSFLHNIQLHRNIYPCVVVVVKPVVVLFTLTEEHFHSCDGVTQPKCLSPTATPNFHFHAIKKPGQHSNLQQGIMFPADHQKQLEQMVLNGFTCTIF